MKKKLTFGKEARKKVSNALKILSKTAAITLGPSGKNVLIQKQGRPLVTKDGATVVEHIEVYDRVENTIVQLAKETALKTSEEVGDGTTTATVLTNCIYQKGWQLVESGVDPIPLQRGLNRVSQLILKQLQETAWAVLDPTIERVQQVASIAANNDENIGKLVATAIQYSGSDGTIIVEEGPSIDDNIEVVEGSVIESGWISDIFIDKETNSWERENVLCLFVDETLSTLDDVVTALEYANEKDKPLLIVASNIENVALKITSVNKLKNVLDCCIVKAPSYGNIRYEKLQDWAILTGTRVLKKNQGDNLTALDEEHFGLVGKAVVEKHRTVLVDCQGDDDEILERIGSIKRQTATISSPHQQRIWQDRVSSMSAGVTKIIVGGATETEILEKKMRVEDSLHSARSAIESGVVPGGGKFFLSASKKLESIVFEDQYDQYAAKILTEALRIPAFTIARNCSVNAERLIYESLSTSHYEIGYNAKTDKLCNLVKEGVIDSFNVVKTALEHAVSIAGICLTADCIITIEQE